MYKIFKLCVVYMVFSSLPFLLLFLPVTVFFYYFLRRIHADKFCFSFLFGASLFYYAYWNVSYILLILLSIFGNYYIGKNLGRNVIWRRPLFYFGIVSNIALLGYYKYTDFLISSVNTVFGYEIPLAHILLPIGISFYTFQQIAYLSDIYTSKHDATQGGFLQYALFVCFFPQLVAGPIVHHCEMMPQFANQENKKINWENMYKGLCFLSIGLAKKVLIADSLSPIVIYCFDESISLSLSEALLGAIAYTLQLYFDFSGYADMAIGCGLFFNITLPFNFNSPYKSISIQDFWRRWHMTLSRWLKDYLYIPLGGSRKGGVRTIVNLFLTFLIGGIWHGAGWTFVLWGALHGGALVVHRIWSQIFTNVLPKIIGTLITFIFVILAWIPFRSVNFDRLSLFVDAATGKHGLDTGNEFRFVVEEIFGNLFIKAGVTEFILLLVVLLGVVTLSPNSQKIIAEKISSKLFLLWVCCMLIGALTILLLPGYKPEFIYFQF